VVNDQVGSPTFTWDLAGVLLQMVQNGAPYGTYHAVNGGSATWYELACETMQLARERGLLEAEVSITPISRREYELGSAMDGTVPVLGPLHTAAPLP
jgi:dTDP-4-dehydrorhamnose reductase